MTRISIHAPREGSDGGKKSIMHYSSISIHAPREGSDHAGPSAGLRRHISIHAPREGSDVKQALYLSTSHYFYPRSPRGERRGTI